MTRVRIGSLDAFAVVLTTPTVKDFHLLRYSSLADSFHRDGFAVSAMVILLDIHPGTRAEVYVAVTWSWDAAKVCSDKTFAHVVRKARNR